MSRGMEIVVIFVAFSSLTMRAIIMVSVRYGALFDWPGMPELKYFALKRAVRLWRWSGEIKKQ